MRYIYGVLVALSFCWVPLVIIYAGTQTPNIVIDTGDPGDAEIFFSPEQLDALRSTMARMAGVDGEPTTVEAYLLRIFRNAVLIDLAAYRQRNRQTACERFNALTDTQQATFLDTAAAKQAFGTNAAGRALSPCP